MIKVCLVVNSLMFGGVEKVIENYLKDFDKSQYHFTIVAQDNSQAEHIIEKMYSYFMKYPEKMTDEYRRILDSEEKHVAVCDYIAGMTDIYCVNYFKKLFLPI